MKTIKKHFDKGNIVKSHSVIPLVMHTTNNSVDVMYNALMRPCPHNGYIAQSSNLAQALEGEAIVEKIQATTNVTNSNPIVT
jgi:hypothetical protein